MQLNDENLNGLRQYLEQTFSPDAQVRQAAEKFLKSVEHQQGYPILILKLIEQSGATPQHAAIRQAAAVLFKNYVKNNWDPERDVQVISEADRHVIKTNLITLMCSVPDQIQRQLSAALSTIGEYDFPEKWQNLLPELVQKLSPDWRVSNGVLLTANTIFKRFRHAFRSDELYKQLKHCLEQFQKPLLDFMKLAMSQLGAQNNKETTIFIMQAIRTMCRIFFSLNWQDLPEFFEDSIAEWMGQFEALLKYENPLLVDASEEDEPDMIVLVQQAVVENLNLYAEKYEDEFKPYLERFTQIIWQLLSSRLSLSPKHDILAATCMKFLRSVTMQQHTKALFEQPGAIREICNTIVIRNLQLRTSDEELFEDNPMDFIRRDIEGSDGDTRRSAARELVRGLLRNFHQQVTQICMELINGMLAEYTADPANKWRLKDVSINLVIAIAVRKESKARGVSELNPLVPVMDFLTAHILPELADPSSSSKILKADAIKFVSTFRTQLTVDMMMELVPRLINLFLPDYFVVHTYAASCLERMLTVREVGANGELGSGAYRFGRDKLAPHMNQILTGLFGILELPNYPENDYLMKAIMRVINVAKEDIIPAADTAVMKLTAILKRICANPSNPIFSHYLFEAISVLVVNVCKSNPAATEQFEKLLFPPFESVLSADIDALCPYVYQVLATLLGLRPQGLSAAYLTMFPIILTPALWERVSNVTALAKLLEAYIRKAPDQIISSLPGVLGVFQKLISAKTSEANAFVILRAIFAYLPATAYASFTPEVFRILMMRLQTRMNGRMGILYVKELLYAMAVFIGKNGPTPMFESLENLQPGMGVMLLEQVWLTNATKVTGSIERKAISIALTRMLCESSQIKTNEAKWIQVLSTILHLFEEKETLTQTKDADDALLELEETGYEAGFSKLCYACNQESDLLPDFPAPKVYLVQSLATLSGSHPGQYLKLVQQQLDPALRTTLESYFSAGKATFH